MFNHVYDNPSQAALHYYLAGIIDGEGCIRIDRAKSSIGNTTIYAAVIQVGMVEKHVPELFYEQFGGSLREERVRDRRSIYRWKLSSQKDWPAVIAAFDGKLLIKQPQLELVKKFLEGHIKNIEHKRYLCSDELLRREGLYLNGRELNAVGAGATTKRVDTREREAIV